MNERIKQLAKQATTIASRETTDLDEWEFIFRKKFAELIIKECIEVANNNRTGMEIKTNTHLTADAIEQHFGVEK
jgi:hypothetical protein